MAATTEKITIQLDDLKTRKVDQRLREHEALARNRRQAEMNPLAAEIERPSHASIWYNTIFAMAVFGILGGLLAWGGGEILRFRHDPKTDAQKLMNDIASETQLLASGRISPGDADAAVAALKRQGAGNPYFAIYANAGLTSVQKDAELAGVNRREEWRKFIANLLSFGLTGVLIATCLSIAEPVVDGNKIGSVINGAAGAMLGLLGGVIVALFVEKLYNLLLSHSLLSGDTDGVSYQQILARAVTWGVLGLFLMLGPGLVMRNAKKLVIGMIGGTIGGLAGGALFDPIAAAAHGNTHISRLIALLAIGGIAGAGTGLIENAAKTGWLKVTAGVIAGKQFILYRNPTFIGAGPECQIFLFRDARIGKRHAAVHILPGGFELENLPLGATTLVNGKSIDRIRLHNGDDIQVGSTRFKFQEKTSADNA